MSSAILKDIAETLPGQQPAVPVSDDVAVSWMPRFDAVKHLLESSPAPRRPNRNRPNTDERELASEIESWQAAGEEALAMFEDSLEE